MDLVGLVGSVSVGWVRWVRWAGWVGRPGWVQMGRVESGWEGVALKFGRVRLDKVRLDGLGLFGIWSGGSVRPSKMQCGFGRVRLDWLG